MGGAGTLAGPAPGVTFIFGFIFGCGRIITTFGPSASGVSAASFPPSSGSASPPPSRLASMFSSVPSSGPPSGLSFCSPPFA